MRNYTLGITILTSLLFAWNAGADSDVITVGSFETGEIKVMRPEATDFSRYLWAHVPYDKADNQRPGSVEITDAAAYSGDKGLSATVDSAMNMFVHFYPYHDYQWDYMHEQIERGTWKNDYYNRMRFWIKTPASITKEQVRQTNFHFGTYVRGTSGSRTSAESGGGGHFYHYYNIGYQDGAWHKIVVDMHPNHERGTSGSLEQGVHEYPTGESGLNYWDLMTRFYVTFTNDLTSYPSTIQLDSFEIYREDNVENETQVYSIHGVYNPKNNQVTVGWMRNKNEDDVIHDVRYSFRDIHIIGWDAATVAPGNSSVTPLGVGGYNGMEYSTSQISVAGQAKIYIAVKPQNSDLFKQISLPIVGSYASPPSAPEAVSVTSSN